MATTNSVLGSTDLIPRKQLAIELGNLLRGKPYHEQTLILWEKDGRGPPVTRVGREVLYRASSVEKWLLEQEKVA